jgi:hypothetical protein
MPRLLFALSALLFVLTFPACGGEPDVTLTIGTEPPADAPHAGDEGPPPAGVPGNANAEDVRVIDEWARALSKGHIGTAAGFFAIPSVAENGVALLRIRNEGQAKLFNASLPCGAKLIHAETEGAFTTATFRLTERPGEGYCGIGGQQATAETAFVIENGKIAEWRRVDTGGPEPPSGDVI